MLRGARAVWWRFKQARLERGGMMQQGLQCGGGSGGERRFDAARQPFVHLYRCRSAAFRSFVSLSLGSLSFHFVHISWLPSFFVLCCAHC